MIAYRLILLALAMWLLPSIAAAAGEDERLYNTLRLRSAIRTSGMEPGPDVDRKLAAMSDYELERLVQEHDDIGYSGNPMTVIMGAVLLLVLVVLLLVAVIE